MSAEEKLIQCFTQNDYAIGNIVDFDLRTDQLFPLDFTETNKELTAPILGDTDLFSEWVTKQLSDAGCRYGIGGYNEHRTIYARSAHFDTTEEPRRLHLGVDIWGAAGTPIYNFYPATVHSFKFNDHYGDYGATIILKYQFDKQVIYGLFGHLNLDSLRNLVEGKVIAAGEQFARFGEPAENGHWPPHLHFQLMFNMRGLKGDYPGVCRFSERDAYLANSPDPALILKHNFT